MDIPETVEFVAKWQHNTYQFTTPSSVTVQTLYQHIAQHFNLNSNIKVLGLFKGKPTLSLPLSELSAINNQPVKLSIIGTLNSELSAISHHDSIASMQQAYEQRERDQQLEQQRQLNEQDRIERERVERIAQQRTLERQKQLEQQQLVRQQREREERARWKFYDDHLNSTALKPEVVIRFELTVQEQQTSSTSAAIQHDRIILPSECLEHIIDKKVNLPLIFAVRRSDNNRADEADDDEKTMELRSADANSSSTEDITHRFCYLSVDSFTAQPGRAIVSKHAMQTYGLNTGDVIQIQNVNLISATHVQLTVLTPQWSDLSELERKALLEQELRQFQHLVLHQQIDIQYTMYHPKYTIVVSELAPTDVVSIVDSDLITDIVIPEHEVKTDVVEVAVNASAPITGSVQPNQYIQYTFTIDDVNKQTVIDLTCDSGDVDLYVTSPAETAWIEPPTTQAYTYSNNVAAAAVSNRKQLTLNSSNVRYVNGAYQLALHGFSGAGKYSLSIKSTDYTPATLHNNITTDSDTTECSNCHRQIAVKSIQMHELQCKRLNYYCTQCAQRHDVDPVISVRNQPKHKSVMHSTVYCICGQHMEQVDLIRHRRDECPQRLVHCVYCPLTVEVQNRGAHQQQCGLATSHCNACSMPMQRKLLKRHCERDHGMTNVTYHNWW